MMKGGNPKVYSVSIGKSGQITFGGRNVSITFGGKDNDKETSYNRDGRDGGCVCGVQRGIFCVRS
jgi:hypothetical protein